MLSCHFLTLVLEEDGTVVDSEEFFQSLPTNTPLMVLEKGDMWTQNKVSIKCRGKVPGTVGTAAERCCCPCLEGRDGLDTCRRRMLKMELAKEEI